MSDVISWMIARDADPASIYFGRVATDRVGTSGHSAGGLQSLVCAARDPRVRASAPLDPVDNNGLGAAALPGMRRPVAITYSEPSSCNADGSSEDLYAAANPQKRGVKLVGANHCDPEKNNDFFGCALTCGSWNATRHQRYLRYVTGWFEYYLKCDASYFEWAWGSRVQSDLAGGVVTYDAGLGPAPPTGVAAQGVAGGIEIRRDPPGQCAGIDGWRVYRASVTGGPYALVADGLAPSATTWVDTTAQPGVTYFYVARDYFSDFRASAESADSNEASASVSPASSPGEASPPGSDLRVGRGPGTALSVTYAPAPCATDHVAVGGTSAVPLAGVEWSAQQCALGASGSATFVTGTVAPGTLLYCVVVGNDATVEGSYGRSSGGQDRPEAVGLSGCDHPQRFGPCF